MKSDMENKDWIDEYTSLKQVNPANPFIVPAGYFDNLEARIVLHKNFSELTANGISTGFIVPGNYFDELAGNIQSRIAIEDIINPAGMGFTVPEGYFENLTEQIEAKVFIEETLGAPEENFAVPKGYFDRLNKDILSKTVNAGEVKQKAVVRKLFASTAFKYATAACFAIAIGGGILVNSLTDDNATDHKNSFLHKELSAVPLDDIKSYLQLNEDAGDTQQTVATEGVAVDDNGLKNALQDALDSAQ